MKELLKNYKLIAFVSGLLTFISMLAYINPVTGWVCYVLFFMAIKDLTLKESFRAGLVFGLAIAIPSFYWIVEGAQRFTGSEGIYGLLVYIISTCLLALYFGGVTYCFGLVKTKDSRSFSGLLNALIIACVFVTGEAMLMFVSKYLPWFGFHSGNTLMDNIYSIQSASVFGIHGMSFIIIFVNYAFADIIIKKQWARLPLPVAVITLYMLSGFFIYQDFIKSPSAAKPVKVAILNGNIAPEIKWNDANGNQLVENLLDLDRQASRLKPDIALWNESAIPWTYRPDDDLVNEILKISAPAGITQVLGINSSSSEDEIYNSVYALLPNGKIAGRYDKRILLAFIEQPVLGFIFPFQSSSGFIVKGGENSHPLATPYGKAGIMVCNESSVPSAASDMANNGAQFLFNLSNDGWFSNTYIADLHFYNVKMRAVETRKDIVYNSNLGFSGFINSSGKIIMKERSDEPYVKTVEVIPNTISTISSREPFLLVYVCVAIIFCFAFLRVFDNYANKKSM